MNGAGLLSLKDNWLKSSNDSSVKKERLRRAEDGTQLWRKALGLIPSNPLTKLGNFKETVQIKQEMQFYTPEESKAFIGSVQKQAEKSAELANVKVIRVHDFRHSHASLLAHEGINIQETARRLEHSKVSTTLNTYSHL